MEFPIKEITIEDKKYPELLKKIADPPAKLYYRGNADLFNTFCFGVVGTRKITSYGREATAHIVSGLAETGWTIVSGLAMGVDAIAHQTALDTGLPTIAVLGSTIDDKGIHPQSNFNLSQEILKNDGLIISEYRNSSEIRRQNFAIRDRIISGLSKGVLIIEGAERSGSLVTARSAADQNRDVFAVPGNIFSAVSKGTNMLIKTGAKMVTSADDILEEYGKNLQLKIENNNNISTKDPAELAILAILDEKGELSADEMIRMSGLETSKILAGISMLELKNKIKKRNGKYTCN
jgi:DNA processing protein